MILVNWIGDENMQEKNIKINNSTPVTAYRYGEVLEMSNAIHNQKPVIMPISKYEYVDTRTGEIMQFEKNNLRIQSPDNLRKTFRKLRRLIIANFSAGDLWITFTYKQINNEPMTDTKRVYKDFKAFWRRFIAKFGSSDYLNCS